MGGGKTEAKKQELKLGGGYQPEDAGIDRAGGKGCLVSGGRQKGWEKRGVRGWRGAG